MSNQTRTNTIGFQEAVLRLNQFWGEQGCVIWQPHNVQVGAGTSNPATFLRVLGPEPWNVGYVEPSDRPADGRYGENPNRWQEYYQYQVILKPDPGNHIELYLQSLEALGIDRCKHDIRFVEDNWQSPALGAWGLGWEVWLDGLEITQYTYFQQAGGVDLNPPCVEITYGLERIVMYLQDAPNFQQMAWQGDLTYGDLHLRDEIDYCKYNFDYADVELLTTLYNLYEKEARNCLAHGLTLPAHDYVLKCSHTFNVLDARGAIGVTERARFFSRMKDLASQVAQAYLRQREEEGYPFRQRQSARIHVVQPPRVDDPVPPLAVPADLVLEIGTEELPAGDVDSAIEQLAELAPKLLAEVRLAHRSVRVVGTPRRLTVYVAQLAPAQSDVEKLVRGPAASAAYDASGQPTRAAEGFARAQGVPVESLQVRDFDGKLYATAVRVEQGRPAREVLSELLPKLIASLRFNMSMRWNETNVTFSRPIRWLVALHGASVVPCQYAGVPAGRISRGLRPLDSPELPIERAEHYFNVMRAHGIVVDHAERRERIVEHARRLAAEVGGQIPDDPDLVAEVTNLVEQPVAIRGSFEERYLALPPEVLVTVMRKHQRYFPVVRESGNEEIRKSGRSPDSLITNSLLPYFVVIANGGADHVADMRPGYENVIRARYADAAYFYREDTKKPLESFVPKLRGLAFQEQLGSYLDKTGRLQRLVPVVSEWLGLSGQDATAATRAAALCKADLVTNMVIEFTSLQGVMGRYYAGQSGEDGRVAMAIFEHYLPRGAGDAMPETGPGIAVGLADRLDSLVGLFAVGLAPTATADRYGLRRAALGLVQILAERQLSFSLRRAVAAAAPLQPVPVPDAVQAEVLAFIQRRFEGWLLDAGFRYDLVQAVLAEQADDPARAYQTVKAFTRWADTPEFAVLLPAYARSVRIVRDQPVLYPLDRDHLTEPASRRLLHAYQDCREKLNTASVDLDTLFTTMQPLVEPINQFFVDILVMTEEKELREARLGLLQHIAALTRGIVDLSKVQGF
jgi:glycyl-tRNA synthetase